MDKIPYWHISNLDYLFLTDIIALKKELETITNRLAEGQDVELEDYNGVGHVLSDAASLKSTIKEATEYINIDTFDFLI